MRKWMIIALMVVGCSSKKGTASKPDAGELSKFEEFTRWGMGMANFSAPPSSEATGGGSDDGGWDTGPWGGDWEDHDHDTGWKGASSEKPNVVGIPEDDVEKPTPTAGGVK